MVERLDYVRYIIISGSLITCFIEIVDSLNQGAGLLHILFYSGSLLLISVVLIFSSNKIVLASIIYLAAMLMLIDDMPINRVSPAMMLFGYSLHLIENKHLNYITYLAVAMIVVSEHIVKYAPADDIVSMIVGYTVFFALNELIYSERQKDVKVGG